MQSSDTLGHFLANLCAVCGSKDTVHECTICRLVFYCSKAHRRQDWYRHSQFCWAINKICQAEGVAHLHKSFRGTDFTGFKHNAAAKCISLLGRGLKTWELEMIYHPRVCQVCREFDWEKLQPCNSCHFVYTCEKKHFRQDHKKWCRVLKTYWEITSTNPSVIDRRSDDLINRLTIKPINEESSMVKILKENYEVQEQSLGFQNLDVHRAVLSELLTYPLTVLFSLGQIQAVNQLEVTVLFVGAENQAEVEPLVKWEKYLLHLLPKIKRLNLVFIGPELRKAEEVEEEYLCSLCDDCRCQGKQMKCEFAVGKFYHEYSSKKHGKVDLICAMNSGMYRQCGYAGIDSWQETIHQMFLRQPAPVLVTEYTRHELKKDLEKLEDLCQPFESIVPFGINPFASLKPGLNVVSDNEAPVIFKNFFCVVLRPKKSNQRSNGNIEGDRHKKLG